MTDFNTQSASAPVILSNEAQRRVQIARELAYRANDELLFAILDGILNAADADDNQVRGK